MPVSDEAIFDFGAGFWKENRMKSGKRIDQLRGQNIPHNSRTIDRTSGHSCIISHKSTDLRLVSYRSCRKVYRMGMQFVRQLAVYKGEVRMDHKIGATYYLHWATDSPDCTRVLEWFIPLCTFPASHESILEQVVKEALILGIEVRLCRIKDY